MRRLTLPMALLPALLSGCAARPGGKGTLAELRSVRPDIAEAKVE